MTPEKYIQNEICKYLKSIEDDHPIFWERRQAGGFSYKKGLADLYAVVDGLHIEIEVKRPGGHQSPRQEAFERLCKKKNILYICVDNADEVKSVIKAVLND